MGVDDCNYMDDIMELHNLNLGDLSILPSSHEFPESQLCVPPDSLDDLEWFPSFSDDFISLNESSISSDHDQNLLVLATTDQHETKGTMRKECVGISEAEVGGFTKKKGRSKKRKMESNQKAKRGLTGINGKRCSHCLTEETPQWRVGPLGPKTLCNACGVRFRSGRLLPEYRPAASPTFDGCRHSNYHKKILKRRGLSSYNHKSVV